MMKIISFNASPRKDDMPMIYSALKQADTLILGTPIYMVMMSGQAKIFMDRLFAYLTPLFSPRYKEGNNGKKLILVYTQGNPNTDMFRAHIDYTEKIFRMLKFDVTAV